MSTTELTNLDASFRGSRGFVADIDRDLLSGVRAWPLWTMLGWNDIRQRYRRSVLGPFWITISVAVFITLARRDLQPHFQNRAQNLSAIPCPWLHHLGLYRPDDRRELQYRSRKANASSGRSGSPTRFTCSAWYGGISLSSFTPSSSLFRLRLSLTCDRDSPACWRCPGWHWSISIRRG